MQLSIQTTPKQNSRAHLAASPPRSPGTAFGVLRMLHTERAFETGVTTESVLFRCGYYWKLRACCLLIRFCRLARLSIVPLVVAVQIFRLF